MTIVLSVLGVAFAAFCVWLTVRLVNRGWKPGRRFWIFATLGLAFSYPMSWGPAIHVYQSCGRPAWMETSLTIYEPLVRLLNSGRPWYLEPYRAYIFWCMLEE
jgi:hypothetical protein